MTPALTKKI
ncbi:hypothetical protein [African swine fever virus]